MCIRARTFIAVLFIIANTWKQLNCPSVVARMSKLRCHHTKKYYISMRKKKLLPCTAK